MNKENYRSAFSAIRPSEETVERIMEMTNKKHNINVKRLVACIAAVVMILCTMVVIANAATDGAVTQAISETASQVVEAAESFSKKIHVFVNGEKVEADVKVEEHTGDDGEINYSGEVYITSPNGGEYSRVEFDFDNSEGDIGYGVGEIDIIINDSVEAAIPTTVAAE